MVDEYKGAPIVAQAPGGLAKGHTECVPELSGEDWYDAEIAPKLLGLAGRCRERGMAMVATVEYAPGERGSTMALPDNA